MLQIRWGFHITCFHCFIKTYVAGSNLKCLANPSNEYPQHRFSWRKKKKNIHTFSAEKGPYLEPCLILQLFYQLVMFY